MARADFDDFLVEHRTAALVGLGGLFLMGVGVLSAVVVSLNQSKPSVQIIPAQEEIAQKDEIVVDVAGAVEVPGVYRLAAEARVNDALVFAGGFSSEADRDWVAKNLNLAQLLSDGAKIYIPNSGEAVLPESAFPILGVSDSSGGETGEKVNLNTASVSQLDELWGIGEKRAQDIIDNRPYSQASEIMTKAGIPKNVFDRIEDQILVR